MSDAMQSDEVNYQHDTVPEARDFDLEVWKHFAEMGSKDKNTMITVVPWLLAFAEAAVGYIVTDPQMIGPPSSRIPHPGRMMMVSALGFFVSFVAGYLALLYGGFSNRNWAKADEVARKRGWVDLVSNGSSDKLAPDHGGKPGRVAKLAWEFARPCNPQTKLAPVFTILSLLALFACLLHGAFFAWSCRAWFLK
jgi:hypothetical protein